jgi:hypothetical protein
LTAEEEPMKRNPVHKLTLSRETLADLARHELRVAPGGATAATQCAGRLTCLIFSICDACPGG